MLAEGRRKREEGSDKQGGWERKRERLKLNRKSKTKVFVSITLFYSLQLIISWACGVMEDEKELNQVCISDSIIIWLWLVS